MQPAHLALFSNGLGDRQDLDRGCECKQGRLARLSAQHRSPSREPASMMMPNSWGTRRRVAALQPPVWHYIIAVTLEPRSRTSVPDSGPGVDDRGAMVWSDCKVWVDPPYRQ